MQRITWKLIVGLLVLSVSGLSQTDPDHPNILLIIADDLGVDVSNGYHDGDLMPTTPVLDSLRGSGLTFENVWATPVCTSTRATVMSGKYGVKTGVLGVPGNLDLEHVSVFNEIENQIGDIYSDAVIGKWHISQPSNPDHPSEHGLDYYMGILGASVVDYYAWDKTENGITAIDTNYVTQVLTDASIDWVQNQNQPWFLWLAHPAPHAPFHEPPEELFTIFPTQSNYRKYLAMIESVDHEIGRLLDSMEEDVRENTIIIFIGDNGTPNTVLQDYPDQHGKSSLYQGGVRVPMIISGAGVTRSGERESALMHVNDIYATAIEVAGGNLEGGLYNSFSFEHLLTNSEGISSDYVYTEFESDSLTGFAIRGPEYKLIEFEDGSQEFYNMLTDSLEFENLIAQGLSAEQSLIKDDFEIEAAQIQSAWSCRDHIRNGDEEGIDCGGSYCEPCLNSVLNQTISNEMIAYFDGTQQSIVAHPGESINWTSMSLLNQSGQLIDKIHNRGSNVVKFNVESFAFGMYFVKMNCDSEVVVKKVVVR